MNGKPGTRAELAALEHAEGLERASGCDDQADKLASLRAKLTAPFKPRPELPDVRLIETALGVVKLPDTATAPYFAGLARKALAVGATVDQALEMAPWLAQQPWARGFTVTNVLAGWPSYLARARANKGPIDEGARPDYRPG